MFQNKRQTVMTNNLLKHKHCEKINGVYKKKLTKFEQKHESSNVASSTAKGNGYVKLCREISLKSLEDKFKKCKNDFLSKGKLSVMYFIIFV